MSQTAYRVKTQNGDEKKSKNQIVPKQEICVNTPKKSRKQKRQNSELRQK